MEESQWAVLPIEPTRMLKICHQNVRLCIQTNVLETGRVPGLCYFPVIESVYGLLWCPATKPTTDLLCLEDPPWLWHHQWWARSLFQAVRNFDWLCNIQDESSTSLGFLPVAWTNVQLAYSDWGPSPFRLWGFLQGFPQSILLPTLPGEGTRSSPGPLLLLPNCCRKTEEVLMSALWMVWTAIYVLEELARGLPVGTPCWRWWWSVVVRIIHQRCQPSEGGQDGNVVLEL